ncbi:SIS domain-containing protein [bacterium]|nr:SIS domain-containing protein [bacterium]
MDLFLDEYVKGFNSAILEFLSDSDAKDQLGKAIQLLRDTKSRTSTIYLIGNGGSAAIAEHMAIDLTKNAGLRAMALSGSPMLTTFSNDYGYENVFQKGLESFADEGDVLIAISSSGTSMNILNACKEARKRKMKIITFSAFENDNPLREMGDLNFWVNSKAFGYVELIHNLLIHYINDAIIGKVEYMIR